MLENKIKESKDKIIKIDSDIKSLTISLPKLEEELEKAKKQYEDSKVEINSITTERDSIKEDHFVKSVVLKLGITFCVYMSGGD